jgi:hypothetical protein
VESSMAFCLCHLGRTPSPIPREVSLYNLVGLVVLSTHWMSKKMRFQVPNCWASASGQERPKTEATFPLVSVSRQATVSCICNTDSPKASPDVVQITS